MLTVHRVRMLAGRRKSNILAENPVMLAHLFLTVYLLNVVDWMSDICWFQFLTSKDLLHFLKVYDSKSSVLQFELLWTKGTIWRCYFGLLAFSPNILTFRRQNFNWPPSQSFCSLLTGNRRTVLPCPAGGPPWLPHIPVFAGIYQEPSGPAQPLPWKGRARPRRSGWPGGTQVAHPARR